MSIQDIVGPDVISLILDHIPDNELLEQIEKGNVKDLKAQKWVERFNQQHPTEKTDLFEFLEEQKLFSLSAVKNYTRKITLQQTSTSSGYYFCTNIRKMLQWSAQQNQEATFNAFLIVFESLIAKVTDINQQNKIAVSVLKEPALVAAKNNFVVITELLYQLNIPEIRDWLAVGAASSGNISLFERTIRARNLELKTALEEAASNNQIQMVNLLKTEVKNTSKAVRLAAEKGHFLVLQILGFYYSDIILAASSYGGHRGLVQITVNAFGAADFDSALVNAARGGHLDLTEFFLANFSGRLEILNLALLAAAEGDFDLIAAKLIQTGAQDFSAVLEESCKNNSLKVFRLILDLNVQTDKKRSLAAAAQNGHLDLIKILTNNKINQEQADFILKYGCRGNKINTVRFALKNGAKRYDFISECGTVDIISLLLQSDQLSAQKNSTINKTHLQQTMANAVVLGDTNSVATLQKFNLKIAKIPSVLYQDLEIYLLRQGLKLDSAIYSANLIT